MHKKIIPSTMITRYKILLLFLMLPVMASATKRPERYYRSVSLGASAGVCYRGYHEGEGNSGTLYSQFAVSPDWQFHRNWGLLTDLHLDRSVDAHFHDVGWQRPYFHALGVGFSLAPYYRLPIGRVALSAAPQLNVRARLPRTDQGLSVYMLNASISAGVLLRADYEVAPRWRIHLSASAHRNVLDYVADYMAVKEPHYRAGNLSSAIGFSYQLRERK